MNLHFIVLAVVLLTALAIAGIIAFAIIVDRINELKELMLSRAAMTLDNIDRVRRLVQGVLNEILETRAEIRKHSDSLVSMFELYAELEEQLWRIEKNLPAPMDPGEIRLPDLSEEFEEKMREEWIENKDVVCRKTKELLQMTRAGEDIKEIRYERVDDTDGFRYEEYAVIEWDNGTKTAVLITGDSGKAIVQDVLKAV